MRTYTDTGSTLNVMVDGQSYTIRKGSKNFDAARAAMQADDWDALIPLLSAGHTIARWLADTGFAVKDNLITYEGRPIDQALNNRLLQMAIEGANPTSWLRFWARLQENPSYRSVHQLYAFLARENIPIDDDGFIVAYKSVTNDYKDFYTRTIDNSIGTIVKMPRNQISDDPNLGCHEGLHIGALPYALSFGTDKRIIICRIDPADVVCVPYDSSYQKMRVCEYEVIGNYSGQPLPSTVLTGHHVAATPPVATAQPPAPEPTPTVVPEPPDSKWTGNDALHYLLRPKVEGGWGLRQYEVIRATGLDSGHISRAARDMASLGDEANARILAAFPDAFADTAPLAPDLSTISPSALMAVDEGVLRAYAKDVLFIVGVAQIPSKSALVQRIVEVSRTKVK